MFLQLWARYVLSQEEGEAMVRPVERDEVKNAIFDIAEDKAPGPDGYSAGFYKAAWSVIGEELTTAIQDFFTTGKLLKQVNATVLSLIPKVANPTTVAEFRPISCCNVLYKAITKIIVQRMQGVMDKIISPPQNAFVPGRRISNNILLGQELFHGYKRQHLPPRCALKVLHLLLLQRIEQSDSFQFHWRCTEMKLFNLCFANDLLLFCKAEEQSVIFFRDALRVFAELSGPHANVNKSQLILSKSASPVRQQLFAVLGFQEGVLPAMTFILPKGTLKAIAARMRKFLSQGGSDSGVAKVAWSDVCRPLEEGGQVRSNSGSWSWRKILKFRNHILSVVSYHVGSGERFLLWHDPWHPLGPLIHRFPRGPSVIGIPLAANLSEVIDEDGWNWPLFTDIGHLEITELLPPRGNRILLRGGQ
ncbi:UNVERIFIED_CONTAM: LINE-1 reverse transcriptase [Sesamum latifolium]|uniref:LINE-1 reverse transcriptase n=1 Tax=Sesamum latifolium TaxID=2727402 RepID=A0AAW2XNC9_9LAMI